MKVRDLLGLVGSGDGDSALRQLHELQNLASLGKAYEALIGSAGLRSSIDALADVRSVPSAREALLGTGDGSTLAAVLDAMPSMYVRDSVGASVDPMLAQAQVAAKLVRDGLAQSVGAMDLGQAVAMHERAFARLSLFASDSRSLADFLAHEDRERQDLITSLGSTSDALAALLETRRLQDRVQMAELRSPLTMVAAESLLEQVTWGSDAGAALAGGPAAAPSLADLFQQLARNIDKIEREAPNAAEATFRKTLLLTVVLFALNLLLQPITDFHIKRWLEAAYQQPAPSSRKGTVEAARDVVRDLRYLDGYRFVHGRPSVKVLVRPAARAGTVGELPRGATVRAIERRDAFTRIESVDADGQAKLAGWVFSRYLKRFE